nr:MAG TPA: hypothetical protein [Caudoviricetes sp.]
MQNWCKIILFSLVFSHFLIFKKMQEPLIYKHSLYSQGFFWFLHKESTSLKPPLQTLIYKLFFKVNAKLMQNKFS